MANTIPLQLHARLKYDEVELLYKMDKTDVAFEKGKKQILNLKQSSSLYKEQSDLFELIGLMCFETGKNNASYAYLDSAITTYLDYVDYYEANKKEDLPPANLSLARKQSLSIKTFLTAGSGQSNLTFIWMEFAKDNFLKHAIGTQLNDPPIIITLENARANMANDAASISYLGTQGNLAVGMAFNTATESIKLLDTEFQLSEFRKFNLQGTISKLSGIYSLLGHTAMDSMLILKGLTLMQYQSLSNRDPNNIRGIAVKQKENANADGVSDEIKSLSKLLYSIYVKPFESIIKDKKKLVICPDFILQIIPFETLIMPDGRYMGEVFDITYTPGFTISNMLSLRAYNTSGNIIAFGNPDYTTYHPEKLSGRALDYSFLGIKSWNELPGTEKELTAIRSQSNVMETKTGNNLSETSLKRMSKNGTLQKASILHFALHGIAGPASSKEDNSLVITEPEGGIEDGLFQFSEALNLEMNAEFVCLSACESGINQIEDDGSMLTMATAFLAAGAKAVLATNWSIDDAATALFIKDVYTQVREQKIFFAAAVANTKRKFIKGDFGEKYKQPLYWAPFKYYGN